MAGSLLLQTSSASEETTIFALVEELYNLQHSLLSNQKGPPSSLKAFAIYMTNIYSISTLIMTSLFKSTQNFK